MCSREEASRADSHLIIRLHLDEALPELDDLQGHEETDGHQVGVQNPEGDQEDEGIGPAVLIVALCTVTPASSMGSEDSMSDCTGSAEQKRSVQLHRHSIAAMLSLSANAAPLARVVV